VGNWRGLSAGLLMGLEFLLYGFTAQNLVSVIVGTVGGTWPMLYRLSSRFHPSIYCTFFAYDEVAHRTGVERRDSLYVLRMLDRMLAHLERAAAAPRPYHLVVLSDHRQSQDATFRQRYEQTLGQLVDELTADRYEISSPEAMDEGLASLNSALAEVSHRDDPPSARFIRRTLW
jgi:hypothetical protein